MLYSIIDWSGMTINNYYQIEQKTVLIGDLHADLSIDRSFGRIQKGNTININITQRARRVRPMYVFMTLLYVLEYSVGAGSMAPSSLHHPKSLAQHCKQLYLYLSLLLQYCCFRSVERNCSTTSLCSKGNSR